MRTTKKCKTQNRGFDFTASFEQTCHQHIDTLHWTIMGTNTQIAFYEKKGLEIFLPVRWHCLFVLVLKTMRVCDREKKMLTKMHSTNTFARVHKNETGQKFYVEKELWKRESVWVRREGNGEWDWLHVLVAQIEQIKMNSVENVCIKNVLCVFFRVLCALRSFFFYCQLSNTSRMKLFIWFLNVYLCARVFRMRVMFL